LYLNKTINTKKKRQTKAATFICLIKAKMSGDISNVILQR